MTLLQAVKRVPAVVAREFVVQYSQTGCRALLRSPGFSPQKPEKRATQRNEDGIREWKRKARPALEKERAARAQPSSSWTSRAGRRSAPSR